jgi:protein arginine N-methyltransferase 1
VRVEAYAQALRKTVRPGAVVVDIGTGTGIFAVLACQLGARRVYAIEPDAIIQVAREIARANQCAEKIEFIEKLSTKITLPEKADVIVSDLRGVLPIFNCHIPAIADARRRFLAPNGALIPRRDTVYAAIVEAPESYAGMVGPWEHNLLGQDLSPARRRAVNNTRKVRLTPEQLLTRPQILTSLDYTAVENPDVQAQLKFSAEREGTGHGMVVWFDTELADGITFSNAPGSPEAIYGSVFFPWTNVVPLCPGQTACIEVEAKLVETEYVWRWTSQIDSANGTGAGVRFDQSSLAGAVLSPARLHKASATWVPHLSEEGRIRVRALEMIDGTATLQQIATRLALEFPQRFARWEQALGYVGTLSQEWGQ